MTAEQVGPRVVSASREIAAGPGPVFELIATTAGKLRASLDRLAALAEGS